MRVITLPKWAANAEATTPLEYPNHNQEPYGCQIRVWQSDGRINEYLRSIGMPEAKPNEVVGASMSRDPWDSSPGWRLTEPDYEAPNFGGNPFAEWARYHEGDNGQWSHHDQRVTGGFSMATQGIAPYFILTLNTGERVRAYVTDGGNVYPQI